MHEDCDALRADVGAAVNAIRHPTQIYRACIDNGYARCAGRIIGDILIAKGAAAATRALRGPGAATNTAMATVDDLSGSALSNYNRFVKNLPAAAETPTIRNLADGALEFSAKVPATNIPGSYATYTKIVGPDGVTTSFIKTTIAPDGSVVSVKVKYP